MINGKADTIDYSDALQLISRQDVSQFVHS